MKLLIYCTMFVGWISFYLCQRTLPSAMNILIPGSTNHDGLGNKSEVQFFSRAYLGQLQSLFSVAYSATFLLGGIMSDFVSVGALFSVCLAASGILLAIFPWTEGHHSLGLVVYLCLGLAQGSAWPFTAKILRQTHGPLELGKLWSVFSTGSSCAFFLSPLLVSNISTSSGSWKYSFYVFGLSALCLALPIWLLVRTFPDKGEKGDAKKPRPSVFRVLLFRDLWGVMFIHSLLWLVRASIPDWGPLYLVQEKRFNKESAGVAIGMMQFGGILGKLVMGYLSDRAMASQRPTKTGETNRTLVMLVNLLLLGVMIAVFVFLGPDPDSVPYLLFVVIFCIGVFAEGAIIIVRLSSMSTVPDSLSGTAQVTAASFSLTIGKFSAGWPFSTLVDVAWIGWGGTLLVLCGFCLLGAVVSVWLMKSFHTKSLKKKAN